MMPTIAWLFIRQIEPFSTNQQITVGLLWLAITLVFELGAALYAFDRSWESMGGGIPHVPRRAVSDWFADIDDVAANCCTLANCGADPLIRSRPSGRLFSWNRRACPRGTRKGARPTKAKTTTYSVWSTQTLGGDSCRFDFWN